ncbi:SDH family Clp fold serine proteinase [Spartinivicinus ruber]|uniref:SDH family Clp fold serine proteinase n=1 Tax=Spartinivicinus ruber TaxID=2683272 RepID=UPI0013D483F8|nr:serine protease [Spartinivicinus ruber]
MFQQRLDIYKDIEKQRNSKIIVFITGDRPGLETQIHSEVYDYFVNHLDKIGVTAKISLYLYTRGGNTLAAWSIVNLIRLFCDELEVIIPAKCHSAGTLMALGANIIIMTKQATLGPIDPSIHTALNPQIEGAPVTSKFPVSVEAIQGFTELAREEYGISSDETLGNVLLKLSEKVHPLVLGEAYRTRSQIKMLADRLISHQLQEQEKKEKIINFLCSESGSHDYTINRREAKNDLGLAIENPSEELYTLIKKLYDDIHEELKLTETYDPSSLLGTDEAKEYELKRSIIESIDGHSYYFVSKGSLTRHEISSNGITQRIIDDRRTFEGWKYEEAKQ